MQSAALDFQLDHDEMLLQAALTAVRGELTKADKENEQIQRGNRVKTKTLADRKKWIQKSKADVRELQEDLKEIIDEVEMLEEFNPEEEISTNSKVQLTRRQSQRLIEKRKSAMR